MSGKSISHYYLAKKIFFSDLKTFSKFALINDVDPENITDEQFQLFQKEKNIYETEFLFRKELINYLKQFNIKSSWVNEMIEAGVIKPAKVGDVHFFKLGNFRIKIKTYEDVSIFNVNQLNWEQISSFTVEKRKKLEKSKVESAEKRKKAVKEYWERYRVEKEKIEKYLEYLDSQREVFKIVLFMYYLNHYAKTDGYPSEKIYRLKTKLMRHLMEKHPDIVQVSFIERGDRIIYCDDCYELASDTYDGWFGSFGDWLRTYEPCRNCKVQKHYYSLFEFVVKIPEKTLTFHIPYPKMSDLSYKKFPKIVDNSRTEYGRAVNNYEKRFFPYKKIIKPVEEYLKKIKQEVRYEKNHRTSHPQS